MNTADDFFETFGPRPVMIDELDSEQGMSMNVLVGCEFSGTVRDAFEARGHNAWSCDLLPAPGKHIQGDVFEALKRGWDLAIVHPPCTYLCLSGIHWNARRPERHQHTEDALNFVRELISALHTHTQAWALENPASIISTRIQKYTQEVQPYRFGHDASKKTWLWLHNLPPLIPTVYIPPRIVVANGKEYRRWANQTDSGQNREPPSADRWKKRAQTYKGIAEAMADQWGSIRSLRQRLLFSGIDQ